MTTQHTSTFPPSEHQFSSFDGSDIFYRLWASQPTTEQETNANANALVLFHGGHEHSGRFQDLVEKLALDNISIFAWDARGHGKTAGRRGYARHYMDVVRDVDAFIRHIHQEHAVRTENMVVMGHSVGSVTVATWLHDYAPKVKGVVLGSPAFDVKLYAPFAYPSLRLWQKIKPDSFVSSYVKPAMLTHDKKEAEERANDALISPDIAVRVLTSLYDTAKRVITDAHTIQTPVLLLSAGKDWVVKRKAQENFIEKLGCDNKEMSLYPGFFHEIYHETERHRPIAKAKVFIEHCFVTPPANTDRSALCQEGANTDTFNALQQKRTGWKKYYYALTTFSLKHIGGKLSKGMQTGWQHGFDSGVMLDYVYDNQANGTSFIGKFIDRTYLDSAGWVGIRQRGENLQQALQESIAQQQKTHDEVHIMDVATGVGRYIINVIEALQTDKTDDKKSNPSVFALCRDRDEVGLATGRERVKAMGLDDVIRYQQGDAFDADSINDTPTQPQIIIVSGLYELFADNKLILQSLQAIYQRLPENGTLIYTNQPWHPQLELIARTLINREQKPWIMRPRSQAEMNQLVEQVGFKPQKMWIDDAGIFTVSIAQK